MIVITADQRASRVSRDLVPDAMSQIASIAGEATVLAPERAAGDEIQMVVSSGQAAAAIVLELTRHEEWSVGVGVGTVETPLPDSVRAARGPAFVNARDAVERAKRTATHVAVTAEGPDHAEAVLRLLVEFRMRRTPEGWEVHDLLRDGLTQRESAERLGITEGAVSRRVSAAGLRSENAALPAAAHLITELDCGSSAR
ncbi:DNA-binding protein [Microbacterium amylolyticum]|uniref:DNA-binding protein n=1 Tax=Microbacterium amylolyticum TaxID=936337 RepID=A0ABS4ZET6_9MICO|nr:DNA-binding protein [Microbacterium amylolyticum]MBP2435518.1 hypothetical protein [Microbacterium amylolyticum]